MNWQDAYAVMLEEDALFGMSQDDVELSWEVAKDTSTFVAERMRTLWFVHQRTNKQIQSLLSLAEAKKVSYNWIYNVCVIGGANVRSKAKSSQRQSLENLVARAKASRNQD